MFCKECGSEIEEDSKFCPKCGRPVGQEIHSQDRNNSAYQEERRYDAKRMQSVKIRPQGISRTEKKAAVFRVSSKTPVIYFFTVLLFVFIAVSCFYERAELYGGSLDPHRNAGRRSQLFMWGMLCIVVAVEGVFAWWGSTKVELIIGDHSISGVRMANLFMVKEFEYEYEEISDIKNLMIETLFIKAGGKWIVFADLENRKKAAELIRQKIGKPNF